MSSEFDAYTSDALGAMQFRAATQLIDANKNGSISLDEANTATVETLIKNARELPAVALHQLASLRGDFTAFDSNADGVVEERELVEKYEQYLSQQSLPHWREAKPVREF